MKSILLIITALFSLSTFADYDINDITFFETDGCSAGAPDGNWGHCCYEHDFSYWTGGSYVDRKEADERLRQCVNYMGGPGDLFYRFVRPGGAGYYAKAWPDQNVNPNITEGDREAMKNEKALWESINRPPEFEFIITETILFPELTPYRKELLIEKFKAHKKTRDYQYFYKNYKNIMGRAPITEAYH